LSNIVQVTGSAYTLVAIDRDGNAWGWGQNLHGAAGVGTTGVVNRPRQIRFPDNAKVDYVAAGEYFFIARGTDGSVYTWGHGYYGQLGTGGRGTHTQPVRVDLGGRKARVVGAAYEGAFAVTVCNEVFAWGDNEASGLGFPGSNYGVQRIERSPTRVPNLSSYAGRIQYIAGGNGWGQALLNDGRVIGWGLRAALGQGTTAVGGSGGHTNGQVITVTQNIRQMHSRYVGTIALTTTGEVRTWGQTGGSAFPTIYGASVTTRNPPPGNTIIQVGGGKEHVYYLTDDGRVWGAGYGLFQKLSLTSVTNRSWPGIIVNLPPN
jgi:alpha-tubulin suppressor-like RCC1 family protein